MPIENGSVWHSLQDIAETTSPLEHRFIPRNEADPNCDSCWVSKAPSEPLGLQLEGMVLTEVHQGSPSHKFGVGSFKGRCLVSINGLPVYSLRDVMRISKGISGLWLGFSQFSSTSGRTAVTVTRVPGPLGCFLERTGGGLVIRKVATDTPASRAGLAAYRGFLLVAVGHEMVTTSSCVQEIWSEASPGDKLSFVIQQVL